MANVLTNEQTEAIREELKLATENNLKSIFLVNQDCKERLRDVQISLYKISQMIQGLDIDFVALKKVGA